VAERYPRGGETPHKSYVSQAVRSALKSLLGESGLYVLEYHLNKRLGRDLYDAFYEDPHGFYRALASLFGSGTDAILRILGKRLIEDGWIEARDPSEFVDAMRDPAGDRRLREMFKPRGGV